MSGPTAESDLADIPPDRVIKRSRDNYPVNGSAWRRKTYEIIFEADTPLGLLFDVMLLMAIVISVGAVCLTTVEELKPYHSLFSAIELVTGILFSIEYVLRIACVHNARKYMCSFFGIVDLLAVLPLFAWGFSSNGPSFAVVRSLRLLRAFRVLGLASLNSEADDLSGAIWRSRAKIVVFLATVMIAVTIAGSAMYEIEKNVPGSKFNDIPQAMYWAIVTMTTVGYGDVVPITTAGKFVSAALILLGYSLIIVPTGFVSAEISNQRRARARSRLCESCELDDHEADALHCRHCGAKLSRKQPAR